MTSNKAAVDWVIRTLACMGFVSVVTICVLAYRGIQIPPELNTLAGGLVGSLGSMLVKTSPTETSTAPAPVTITQPDNQPVPVVETPKP